MIIRIQPALEDEDRPQAALLVNASAKMIPPNASDRPGFEKCLQLQQIWIEERLRPVPKRPSKPFAERDRKAHLGAVDKRLGPAGPAPTTRT